MENKFIDILKKRINSVKTMTIPVSNSTKQYNDGVRMGISIIESIVDDMINEKICPICYDCPHNCPIEKKENNQTNQEYVKCDSPEELAYLLPIMNKNGYITDFCYELNGQEGIWLEIRGKRK